MAKKNFDLTIGGVGVGKSGNISQIFQSLQGRGTKRIILIGKKAG